MVDWSRASLDLSNGKRPVLRIYINKDIPYALMFYKTDFTIPSGTLVGSPVTARIRAAKGILHRLRMVFPSGCAGLVGVQLFHGGHPITPTTQGQWIKGDGTSFDLKEFYPLPKDMNLLTIKGYNTDTVYSHTILIGIGVLPRFVLLPVNIPMTVMNLLRAVFVPQFRKEFNQQIEAAAKAEFEKQQDEVET